MARPIPNQSRAINQCNSQQYSESVNDYFTVEPDAIRSIESVLTMVGGKIVYGNERYATLAPALPPVSPDWSPVAHCGGYNNSQPTPPVHEHTPIMAADGRVWTSSCGCGI